MKPSLGRIVLVPMDPTTNNGSDVAPAVITRVWTDTMINVKILTDAPADQWRTSLTLLDQAPVEGALPGMHMAWWPPRVG